MKSETREIIIGMLVVCAGALVFIANALAERSEKVSEGYVLTATFPRVDGLTVGADVRMAGISIGRVTGMQLDDRYRSVLDLTLRGNVAPVPEDSAAVVETDGLLGGKYIEISPGAAEDMLVDGDEITYTQGAVVLDELLGKIIAMAKARRADAAAENSANTQDAQ